jgi:hypothetical protein
MRGKVPTRTPTLWFPQPKIVDFGLESGAQYKRDPRNQVYGYICRYDAKDLKGAIDSLKVCLGMGYVVRARLVSGWWDEEMSEMSHSILIIGYSAREDYFVFWDPDALVSNRPETGPFFGTLTYDDGAAARQRFGVDKPDDDMAVAGHPRFSTARTDLEMRCRYVIGRRIFKERGFQMEAPSREIVRYRGVKDWPLYDAEDGPEYQDSHGVTRHEVVHNHRYQVKALELYTIT